MRTLLGCWFFVTLLLVPGLCSTAQPPNVPALPGELRAEDIIRVLAAPAFRHASSVNRIAVSGDGKQMVTGTKDGAYLWDVASGKKLTILASGDVRCLALAGDLVAIGMADGLIGIIELGTGKKRIHFTHPGAYPIWLALSPDGSTLAFSLGGEIQLWSVPTGKQIGTLTGHGASVGHAVFHPDGTKLYSASADATLRQWNLATHKETKCLTMGPAWIGVAVAMSKDGASLAMVVNSPFGDKLVDGVSQVRILNTTTWKERFRAELPQTMAHDVHISANGRFVAAVMQWPLSNGPHIPLWDTWTAKQARLDPESPQLLQAPANGLQFLVDGKTLASAGDDGCIRLWDVADGKQHARTKGMPEPIAALTFSPSGNVVASVTPHGGTRLWDAVKGGPLHHLAKTLLDEVAFSSDGRLVLALMMPDATSKNAGSTLWDVRSGQHLHTFKNVFRCAAFSPDGKTLAGGDDQNGVRLWDVAKGTEIRRLSGHVLRVLAVAYSGDGAMLASASDDGNVRVWQVATGKCLVNFSITCRRLWFSPDGSLLFLTADDGHCFNVCETATGNRVLALTHNKIIGQPLQSAPYPTTRGSYGLAHGGATLMYAGLPGRFSAIDMASGETLGQDMTYGGLFTTAEFSSDGKMLALGYADGGVVLCKPPLSPAGKPLPVTMAKAKLAELWQVLAEPDAKPAFQARWLLSAASKDTLPLLRTKLQPVKVDAKQVAVWIGQLDSSSFKVREHALTELEKTGDAAEGALQAALERAPSLEAKLRIELLLSKLSLQTAGESLRTLRAIVILETIGNDEARAILRDLADGAPGARVTEAAKSALKRLQAA